MNHNTKAHKKRVPVPVDWCCENDISTIVRCADCGHPFCAGCETACPKCGCDEVCKDARWNQEG